MKHAPGSASGVQRKKYESEVVLFLAKKTHHGAVRAECFLRLPVSISVQLLFRVSLYETSYIYVIATIPADTEADVLRLVRGILSSEYVRSWPG